MGRTNGPKLPSFCLNRIRPLVRVRSPTIQSKPEAKTEHNGKAKGSCGGSLCNNNNNNNNAVKEKSSDHDVHVVEANSNNDVKPGIERKIMIVVDSSFEAKSALQWALSHTVQCQDKLLLLHVTKPSGSSRQGKVEELSKERAPRAYELVYSMRNLCQSKRPEVEIEVAVVQGKEKGPTIVEEAKRQGVAMLVLGQKKRAATTWHLLMMWAGHRVAGGGVVEYCIQNADCMAIAVRRKNRRHGGYLITTKRHKDFWLLA